MRVTDRFTISAYPYDFLKTRNKSMVDNAVTQFDEMYWNKWCVNVPAGSTRIPIE
jgi:hypothetical protein